MAEVRGILGQRNPSAATLEILYTVPADHDAMMSTFVVCNRSAVATSFRMAISPLGAAISDEMYEFFDRPIGANDTFAATFGWTLGTTDVVRVYATLATLSFTACGLEITI